MRVYPLAFFFLISNEIISDDLAWVFVPALQNKQNAFDFNGIWRERMIK